MMNICKFGCKFVRKTHPVVHLFNIFRKITWEQSICSETKQSDLKKGKKDILTE